MTPDTQSLLESFDYAVRAELLPPALAATFLPLAPDAAIEHFLSRAIHERAGTLKTFAFAGLRRVLSDYDAYGMLRMYQLHLLGTEQWAALLGRGLYEPRGTLLDVGAGDGGVTRFARPLFSRIVVTERSRSLRAALRRQGFRRVDHDLGEAPWPEPERFDVVSVLNVLDRTPRPRSLLAHARDALAPSGQLVVSVPLPLRPIVYDGPRTLAPEESLPDACEGFEQGVTSLARDVLEPARLSVQRWTRLPYVSQGDSRQPFYVLDAVVFACVASR